MLEREDNRSAKVTFEWVSGSSKEIKDTGEAQKTIERRKGNFFSKTKGKKDRKCEDIF